jgi:Fur family ferric uptake transcriptional regulator
MSQARLSEFNKIKKPGTQFRRCFGLLGSPPGDGQAPRAQSIPLSPQPKIILPSALQMKGTRNTAAKSEILTLLTQSPVALAHSEIMTAVKDLCDRVTVYRILDRLIEEGHLHKIVQLDGVTKYAACKSCHDQNHRHDHVHFTCVQCESVVCLEQVEPVLRMPNGYKVFQTQFNVSGLCPVCVVQDR